MLDRLANAYGILPSYYDVFGREHRTSEQTARELLLAMGLPVDSDLALRELIAEQRERDRGRLIPPVQVVTSGPSPIGVMLSVPRGDRRRRYRWRLVLEQGDRYEGEFVPEQLPRADGDSAVGLDVYTLDLPVVETLGYHQLTVEACDGSPLARGEMSLIVAPQRCYQPPPIEHGARWWGLAAQLYALDATGSWGSGGFRELHQLVELAADLGAATVGLNPLHALYPHNPRHASPYSPSSRMFFNVLYLDIEAMDDYREDAAARETATSPEFRRRLARAQHGELIDYAAVAELKRPLLEQLFSHFRSHHAARSSPRGRAFREFVAEGGRSARLHAVYEALQEHFHARDPEVWGWPCWPEEYRRPGPAVEQWTAAHLDRVEFFLYLQWQCRLQLEAISRRCAGVGLPLGLYTDLAVGVDTAGAEVWANRELYALRASAGAPPDALGPLGQDWGLPPFVPHRLVQARYQPFIDILRSNMRYSGALRIDHVMGLMRLFWVPRGRTAQHGAYVGYPLDDLIGIVALESHRNRCLVIGEDLGTVPPEVRDVLGRRGVLSYRLLIFERDSRGQFIAPQHYPRQALVAVTTHDLPTVCGYWTGRDFEIRDELDLFPSPEVREEMIADRAGARAALVEALRAQQLEAAELVDRAQGGDARTVSDGLVTALHRYLARTPADLMIVQLEDLIGQRDQCNLPGTTVEHPNWRRRLGVPLERLKEQPRLQAVIRAVIEERGSADTDGRDDPSLHDSRARAGAGGE